MSTNFKLRESIIALKQSKNKLFRFTFFAALAAKNCIKFIISSTYREQSFSKIKYRKHFHQPSHYTQFNRYPDLFEICRFFLKEEQFPKILSFGCSTGEEVFSLGTYLPNAAIVGADISDWCIRACQKKNTDKRFIFLHSKSREFEKEANFDAIFCLAVFQHYNNREKTINRATKYIFKQFEEQVLVLDKKLKPGGGLFIANTDFDFMETKIGSGYIPLAVVNNKFPIERPLFNRLNNKVGNITETYRVFVKSKL